MCVIKNFDVVLNERTMHTPIMVVITQQLIVSQIFLGEEAFG